MGLNIRDIVPKKEISFNELKHKTFCVDAFNVLYQFLSTVRQADGTPLMDSQQRITSHLSGLFYRNVNLLSEGVKLVYVFDGKPPDLKGKIHAKRQESRDKAEVKYEAAKKAEDVSAMRKYSSALTRLNDEMIAESKELLAAMGIPVVQAPGEGEASAAHLARTHDSVYGVVSQDYDSLLFGAPMLVQNLTMARKRKTQTGWVEVRPEVIELRRVLNLLEINLDQLICLGILVGTDYNPRGIPGIGQKKALQLVRQYEQPVLIFKHVEEKMRDLPSEDQFDWKEIFSLFHKPAVTDVDAEIFSRKGIGKIDEAKIKEILVERHEFSESRIDKQLEKLYEVKEASKQKTLADW